MEVTETVEPKEQKEETPPSQQKEASETADASAPTEKEEPILETTAPDTEPPDNKKTKSPTKPKPPFDKVTPNTQPTNGTDIDSLRGAWRFCWFNTTCQQILRT